MTTALWDLETVKYCQETVLRTLKLNGNYCLKQTTDDWYPSWHIKDAPEIPLVLVRYWRVLYPGCRQTGKWRLSVSGADDTEMGIEGSEDMVKSLFILLPDILTKEYLLSIGFEYL